MLRSLGWKAHHYLDGIRIDLRVATFLYAMGIALCSQSPPPPLYVTTVPTLYRASSIDYIATLAPRMIPVSATVIKDDFVQFLGKVYALSGGYIL